MSKKVVRITCIVIVAALVLTIVAGGIFSIAGML